MNAASAQTSFALKKVQEAIESDSNNQYGEALDAYREAILALENVLANSDDSWQDSDELNDAPTPVAAAALSEESRARLVNLRNQYVQRVDLLLANTPPHLSAFYNGKGFGVRNENLSSMSSIQPDGVNEPFLSYDAFFEVVANDDPSLLEPPEPIGHTSENSHGMMGMQQAFRDPHRPFRLMKLLRRTMTTGGMLTPRLHVPRQVWFQSGAKFIAIESKFAACEELFLALQTCRRGVYGDFVSGLYQSESANGGIRNLDGNAVNRVLDEFDPIVETVRRDLAKKLRYLELDGNKNTGGSLSRGAGGGGSMDDYDGGAGEKAGTLQKWGSLLTRSFSSIGSKKAEKVADLSAYIELLSRLFNLCEMLEDWMTHFERTKSFESNLVVDRLGKVSQFFESTILVFIVKDFEILMERYLKKMGQIALLPV